MADAFIGEIRAFPYTFTPENWLLCDGSVYSIGQFQALAAIVGTLYGGNGQTTFAVPNLSGTTSVGQSTLTTQGAPASSLSPVRLGGKGGTETVQLAYSGLPLHNHLIYAESAAYAKTATSYKATPTPGVSYLSRYFETNGTTTPTAVLAYNPVTPTYTNPPPPTTSPSAPVVMSNAMLSPQICNDDPHENRQPYVPMRFCICWNGDWPERP
ncbi:phage tail protein [Paramagnetospirillum magneticum]|nr:tail fiber protein [Paramagnetospirillum magneticum]